MATKHDPADEPFFREWQHRQPNERRSRQRAAQLKKLLALDKVSVPVLTVVGSKGKGTIATYASATLAATCLRVGTLTSPSMLSNRERIRVDGSAISPDEYSELSSRLSALVASMPPPTPGSGYLAPTGLFTLAGVRHFVDTNCEVIVLEAGMGGRSDEVSLFPPIILAVGSIFGEHIGLLGANPAEIAQEKIGVATSDTRWVISVSQSHEVSTVLEKAVRKRLICQSALPIDESVIGKIELPPGFSQTNAKLGIAAGLQLVREMGLASPNADALHSVLSTIKHPGRLSVHNVSGTSWVLDAAVDERGVATALDWCKNNVAKPDRIFVSFPDTKDVAGAQRALRGYDYIAVAVEAPHLKYSPLLWPKPLIPVEDIRNFVSGKCILMIGTMSFIAVILDTIGVSLEHLFEPRNSRAV